VAPVLRLGLPKLDQRVAEKLAASPAFLDLNPQSSGWDTLLVFRRKLANGEPLTAIEQTQMDSLNAYFDHFIPVIAALRELGLVDRMGFGSDAGPFDTEFGHLEYSVEIARLAGLSPMESLQVVTRNAARLCQIGDQVGTIEPGKQADLLLLGANPLDDVQALTQVVAVFEGGKRVV